MTGLQQQTWGAGCQENVNWKMLWQPRMGRRARSCRLLVLCHLLEWVHCGGQSKGLLSGQRGLEVLRALRRSVSVLRGDASPRSRGASKRTAHAARCGNRGWGGARARVWPKVRVPNVCWHPKVPALARVKAPGAPLKRGQRRGAAPGPADVTRGYTCVMLPPSAKPPPPPTHPPSSRRGGNESATSRRGWQKARPRVGTLRWTIQGPTVRTTRPGSTTGVAQVRFCAPWRCIPPVAWRIEAHCACRTLRQPRMGRRARSCLAKGAGAECMLASEGSSAGEGEGARAPIKAGAKERGCTGAICLRGGGGLLLLLFAHVPLLTAQSRKAPMGYNVLVCSLLLRAPH